MFLFVLALLGATFLYGADEQRLAVTVAAESAFARVQLAADPALHDVSACVQAEAALLPVASPQELPVAHFRKGYCLLATAASTGDAADFSAAANEFDKAMGTWAASAPKNRVAEPIPAPVLVLASVARLRAASASGSEDLARNAIAAALAEPTCGSSMLTPAFCQRVLRTGREWLGWMALRRGDLNEAAIQFAGSTGTGWPEWVAGRESFVHERYGEAAADYRRAIELLHPESLSLARRLGPPSNQAEELVELGGAQLLAGDATGAIASLDAAVRMDPTAARAFFLRGRAKELKGQTEAALADYNLAARTAFAGAKDLASGEAHLYRGILYYRRKDYSHAEDEFASALNFTIAGGMRPDAVAWRHLAAVAGGSCGASRLYLEQSLRTVSPYFPAEEAQQAAAGCPPSATAQSLGAGPQDR
jgi:tetratricopeptide (TPR) repeat protein